MTAKKELVAYCGIYCGDCLGYTGVSADAAEAFAAVLDRYQFERTAAWIFPEELAEFDRFRKELAFMTGLRCPGRCRRAAGEAVPEGCAVRTCCIERGIYACSECAEFETCAKLRDLHRPLHLNACLRNLRAMRGKGLDAWLAEGPRHCYWMEDRSGGTQPSGT
jgi:hypothetical protein